jgi:hypothetical protein
MWQFAGVKRCAVMQTKKYRIKPAVVLSRRPLA